MNQKPKGKTIAIVDDEEALAQALGLRLQSAGYVVELFHDPEEALAALHALAPDLFVVDYRMPKMNGLEFCEAVRRMEKFKTTPVLLLTAYSSRESRLLGFKSGVDAFMGKPYDPLELVTRIQNLLEKKTSHEEEIETERLKILKETAVAISHEIMTPLSAISLSAEHLKRANGVLSKSDGEELDIILQSLVKIRDLIYKLQAVSGVATGTYHGEVSMIDLEKSGGAGKTH